MCDIGGKERKEGGRAEVGEEENWKAKLVREVPSSPRESIEGKSSTRRDIVEALVITWLAIVRRRLFI